MNKLSVFVFLCMVAVWGCSLSLRAEVIGLNDGWQFQRLGTNPGRVEIHNQGSDWESQYHVVHVESSSVLQVPADTLECEFALLKRGNWETVRLPHTPFVEDLVVVHQWQGISYYKKKLKGREEWKDKVLWLEFEGAMSLADVWVNGKHVLQHAGGYLPFVIDLSGKLDWEGENEILVRLDNRDNGLIPPGKPLSTLDFCYYGGLYRDVRLIVKSPYHITHPILAEKVAGGGVFIRYPEVSAAEAVVNLKCEVANTSRQPERLSLRYGLYEVNGLWGKGKPGKRVAERHITIALGAFDKKEAETNFRVSSPRLWSPDVPHLYELRLDVMRDGRVVDSETHRIGIRRIEMSKEKGCLINGQPVRLVGSNRHMEYPYVGNALSDQAQWRDIYQIKMNGFNVVRLGHYPQDPSVLQACDELGVLAIEPIPGWQYFNKDSLFIGATYRDIRHLIRRDRNHPSIIMWETTLNESWPPASWKDGAVRVTHEEYPGDQCFASGDAYGYYGYDVCYNDWQEGFKRPNKSDHPSFIREYYDYEFGGHYSTSRISRKDGEKALLQNAWNAQWSHNRYRKQYPATMGDAVWSMYDYNRGCCDNVCYSGVADLFRLPKYSLHFFRTQLPVGTPLPEGNKKPEVFIASRWTEESRNTPYILVYGNVDEVELLVNGRSIGKQQPDGGADTEYVSLADGGNCRNLTHAPFTFKSVSWQPGSVKAIGFRNGKKVAEYEVKTPGKPRQLEIGYFESGCPAAKNDLLIVYVRLKDENGTLVPINDIPIRLEVEGGRVRGPEMFRTEAGIAAFLVETGEGKQLQLRASGEGMQAAKKWSLR